MSVYSMVTLFARSTDPLIPGMDRQPSPSTDVSSENFTIFGFAMTIGDISAKSISFSSRKHVGEAQAKSVDVILMHRETSITQRDKIFPTCGAAMPIPSALYMAIAISAASFFNFPSNFVIWVVFFLKIRDLSLETVTIFNGIFENLLSIKKLAVDEYCIFISFQVKCTRVIGVGLIFL